jgi:S1-C subfamily serine protease
VKIDLGIICAIFGINWGGILENPLIRIRTTKGIESKTSLMGGVQKKMEEDLQTKTENENPLNQPLETTPATPPPEPTHQTKSTEYSPKPAYQSHTKQIKKHALAAVLIISMLATSLISATALYSVGSINAEVTTLQNQIKTLLSTMSSAGSTAINYTNDSSTSLSALYAEIENSVVTIDCTTIQYYSMPFSRQKQSVTSQVQGSGFVYEYNGEMVIITNNHVIDGASTIVVTFTDGNTYNATLIGAESTNDLAVLSINTPTSKYYPLEIASSSTLSVGDAVIVIGSPYGLSGTMTTGIISALDRTISVSEDSNTATTEIAGLIQTSAPINSGNSGGPLLTYDGKVVGITTAIVGNSDGLGFAVPSDTILSFLSQKLT